MKHWSERLNRLVIESTCQSSWDAMQGDGPRRFCEECKREVLDFAQLTPAEIHGHLQASRGKLCARLTKQDGRLVTARPAEPPLAATSWARQRVSALAASLVSAWLSAASAEAQSKGPAVVAVGAHEDETARGQAPAPRSTTAPGAGLRGRVTAEGGVPVPGVEVLARNGLDGREYTARTGNDGTFAFATLPIGIYDVEGSVAGFDVDRARPITLQAGEQRQADLTARADKGSVLMGAMAIATEPLQRMYDESDLVVVAVLGRSTVVANVGGSLQVATDLRIESLVKGTVEGRKVTYRHLEYAGDEDTPAHWLAEVAPGTRVLAFLERARDGAAGGRRALFEAVSYPGIKRLTDAETAAYVVRLEALARLEHRAERRGETDPADLVEWLTGTAEDPYTRGEVAYELRSAVDQLAEHAADAGTSVETAAADLQSLVEHFRDAGGALTVEPRPELLGAYLTDGQRERLTAALRATSSMRQEDYVLFELVQRWDPQAATDWVVERLRTASRAKEADAVWWLPAVAVELKDESLKAIAGY